MEEENKPKAEETAEKTTERTFTREEFNKAIIAEKNKLKEQLKAEMEAEKNEAERLAKLSSEERYKEDIAKVSKERDEARNKLTAYELKEQTIKDNQDIPVDLINLIDFRTNNTAELVKVQIENIKTIYKKSVELGVNEAMKEKTPRTVVNDTKPKKSVSRISI